jgi:hypothetical protein
MAVNDGRRVLKLTCPCSSKAVLARIRGVNTAEAEDGYEPGRPVWAYQIEQAFDADWLGDWSWPYGEHLRTLTGQLRESTGDRDQIVADYIEQHQSPESNMGSPLGKWRVTCRRVKCGRSVQGSVDDLARLVLAAFAAGRPSIVLDERTLARVRSAVARRVPVDLSGD